MDRLTGKIKWFSRDRSRGALASIGGINLAFTAARASDTDDTFTEGQIVTYRNLGEGALGQAAQDVRAQA